MLSTDLLAHYRRISQQPLTVVDVETTGRYASSSRVIEVSVLQASLADGIQQQQTDLIHPQSRIPAKITRFTGISQAMVEAAPPAAAVWPAYWPLLNAGILTAHNLEFDYSFLQAEFRRLGTTFDRPDEARLCTVQLARLMLPDLPSRSLPNLVRYFQFPVDHSHRAAADTLACWLLAERLLNQILQEADSVLLERFARQWIPAGYAAELLGCAPSEAIARLNATGAASRWAGRGRSGTIMYRRGEVERLADEQPETTQLSWF